MSKLEFSIEKLIEEVKKRPCLYNTTMPEYRDKKGKDRGWLEVCREVCTTNTFIQDWDDLDEGEKTDFLIEVKRKWSSLRDCFKRELKLIEKNEHKKRKYYYFDALQFLVPFKTKQPEVSVENENKIDVEINIKQEFITNDAESEQFGNNSPKNIVQNEIIPDGISQINTQNEHNIEESSQNDNIKKFDYVVPTNTDVISERNSELPLEKQQNKRKIELRDIVDEKKIKRDNSDTDDEDNDISDVKKEVPEKKVCNYETSVDDQAFLQSILPTFKDLNTDQKFRIRIEIMQTILKFKQDNKI